MTSQVVHGTCSLPIWGNMFPAHGVIPIMAYTVSFARKGFIFTLVKDAHTCSIYFLLSLKFMIYDFTSGTRDMFPAHMEQYVPCPWGNSYKGLYGEALPKRGSSLL